MSKSGDQKCRTVAPEPEENQLQFHKKMIVLGDNIRAERNRLEYTQAAFADFVGVSESTLKRIESPNSTYSPSFRDIFNIANALGKSVDAMMLECDPQDDPMWLASQIECYATLLNEALKKQSQ